MRTARSAQAAALEAMLRKRFSPWFARVMSRAALTTGMEASDSATSVRPTTSERVALKDVLEKVGGWWK